jgi:hypothetical protein
MKKEMILLVIPFYLQSVQELSEGKDINVQILNSVKMLRIINQIFMQSLVARYTTVQDQYYFMAMNEHKDY